MRTKVKWIFGSIIIFTSIICLIIFLFRSNILEACGTFMAPGGNYSADIAILEGTEYIDRGVVKKGFELLSAGKVKRVAVVLHRIAPSHRPFALNEDYPLLVQKELETIGLSKDICKVIVTHIHDPITLISAEEALKVLSQDHIKSAILLSQGFHTRRSYLVYQYLSTPLQIKIFPYACFNQYELGHWWLNERAVRDFWAELLKLAYYIVRGHIPLKLQYSLS